MGHFSFRGDGLPPQNKQQFMVPFSQSWRRLRSIPIAIALALIPIIGVNTVASADDDYTEFYSWGVNWSGRLGLGPLDDPVLSPAQVTALANVTVFSAGEDFSCAVSAGTLYCWGDNSEGQLGDGTKNSKDSPVAVAGAIANLTVTDVSAGEDHTCAVAGGKVYCWGANGDGQLGDGSSTDSTLPVPVSGLTNATSVSVEYDHSCAVASGKVYCWGDSGDGRLGTGSTSDQSSPVEVQGLLTGKKATKVEVGEYHSCALAGGELYCWGDNYYGQLGNGTSGSDALTPVKVSGLSNVTEFDAGDYRTCAIKDGAVYCWGRNDWGQLNDSGSNLASPTQILSTFIGRTMTYITVGGDHQCAISDATAYCWGTGSFGRLGNGSESDSTSPVQVSTISNVTAISAGDYHTLARVGTAPEEGGSTDDEDGSEDGAALPDTGAQTSLWMLALGTTAMVVGASVMLRRVS